MLALRGEHQTGMGRIPSSIPTAGNFQKLSIQYYLCAFQNNSNDN